MRRLSSIKQSRERSRRKENNLFSKRLKERLKGKPKDISLEKLKKPPKGKPKKIPSGEKLKERLLQSRSLIKHLIEIEVILKPSANTLQHWAAHKGSLEMLSYLKKKADLSTDEMLPFNKNGVTPLHIAASQGNAAIVNFLMGNPKDITASKLNAVNKKGLTALHKAVKNNHLDVVEILIKAGATIGANLLHIAASKGRAKIVAFLITNIPKDRLNALNTQERTALHEAVTNNHPKIVDLLIKAGANIETIDTSNYETPLLTAAFEGGRTEIVKRLIDAGANKEASNRIKNTSLHIAAIENHLETVNVLIETGAIINSKNQSGNTPLHSAIESNHLAIVKSLVEAGADINTPQKHGYTPLHWAIVKSGNIEILNYLLAKGADIEAKDEDGRSPLHLAVHNNQLGMVKALIAHGAKVLVLNRLQRSPLKDAKNSQNPEMLNALEEAAKKEEIKDIEEAYQLFRNKLDAAIKQLEIYRDSLPNGGKKSAVNELVGTLTKEVTDYFKTKNTTVEAYTLFKKNLLAHLNPDNANIKKISAYRLNLKTIFKSIFLALTVFGLVIGKLTNAQPGSLLFFGPQGVRGREKIDDLKFKIKFAQPPHPRNKR